MRHGSAEIRDLFSLFPACAGVILSEWFLSICCFSVPRMCGGDPLLLLLLAVLLHCSPHVRG